MADPTSKMLAMLVAAMAATAAANICPKKIFRPGDPCVQRDNNQNTVDWSKCCGSKMTCEDYGGMSAGHKIVKVCKLASTNTKPYEICPGSKDFTSPRGCTVQKDCGKTTGKCVHPTNGWGAMACKYSCVDKNSVCHKEIANPKNVLCKLLPSNFANAKQKQGKAMVDFCKSESRYANACPCTMKELQIPATCSPTTTAKATTKAAPTTTTAATTTAPVVTAAPTTTAKPTTTTLDTCGPGERLEVSTNKCVVCTEGTFQKLSNHQATSCQTVQTCEPGQFSKPGVDDPTLARDRVCRSHGKCDAATQYISVKGTSTTDAECATYTTCMQGEYVEQVPQGSADRKCKRCPPKTFSIKPNQDSCTDMTSCVANEYMMQAGTSNLDRKCWPCPRGTVQPLAKHHETKDKCTKKTSTSTTSSTSTSKPDAIVEIWDEGTDTAGVKSRADGVKLLAQQKSQLESMVRRQTAASEAAVTALKALEGSSTKGLTTSEKNKLAAKTAVAAKHAKAKAARLANTQKDLAWVAETYQEAVDSDDECHFGPASCGGGKATTTTTTTTIAAGTTTPGRKAGTAASSAKEQAAAAVDDNASTTAASSSSKSDSSGVLVAVVVALLVVVLAVATVALLVVRQKAAAAPSSGFENPMYAHSPAANASQFMASAPGANDNTGYLQVSART